MRLRTEATEGRRTERARSIAVSRDRMQSRVLVALVVAMLVVSSVDLLRLGVESSQSRSSLEVAFGVSLTFGLLVWVLRAATPAAALCGSLICLVLSYSTERPGHSPAHSGLAPLLALFILTFLATRLGRARKQMLGLAEAAHGRNAAQVIANLGAAGLAAGLAWSAAHHPRWPVELLPGPVLMLSALAEAAADTVSSEIGQAFGGTPWLITRLLTRLRRVPPGTDGAISLIGTLAGLTGAAMVVTVGAIALRLSISSALIALVAGFAGLLFDSLLGATFERRSWLGNDLVNFSSTVFAVFSAALLLAVL